MVRGTVLFVAPLLWAAASSAQVCTARFEGQPDAKWTAVPLGTASEAAMKTVTHLRCLTCKPEISVSLAAGPASPALQNMPIGRKTGLDWARAVVEDPASREGFRESVLRSELRSSPGCSLKGAVTGVDVVGNLGAIGTAIEAECSQGAAKLLAEFYSAYDYACQYQVQVVWPAAALSPALRDDVKALLKTTHFGQ